MNEKTLLTHWSYGYIRRTPLIGCLYSIVPTCLWFAWVLLNNEFRGVYALRLGLALVVGGLMGAWAHARGVTLWLNYHRSPQGPIRISDGALIGAGVGFSGSFIPPLTSLIATHHLEMAKSFIIVAWVVAPVIGGLIGAVLTSIGRQHIDRSPAVPSGE